MKHVFGSEHVGVLRNSFREEAINTLCNRSNATVDPSTLDYSSVIPTALHGDGAAMSFIREQLAFDVFSRFRNQHMPSRGSSLNAQEAISSNQSKQPRNILNDRNLEQEDTRESSNANAENRPSSSSSAEEQHCICGGNISDSDKIFLICCDRCNVWYHGKCVKISKKRADQIEYFYCPVCCANNPGLKSVFKDSAADASEESINESNIGDEDEADFDEFTSLQDIFVEHNGSSLTPAYRALVNKKLNVSLKGPESSTDIDVTPAVPPAFRNVPDVFQKIRRSISDHVRHYVYNKRITEVIRMAAPSLYQLFEREDKPTEEEVSDLIQKALDAAIEKHGWTARIPALKILYKRATKSKIRNVLSAISSTRSDENLSGDEMNDTTGQQPSECPAEQLMCQQPRDMTEHGIEDFISLSQIFVDGREGMLTPEYQQCVLEVLQVTADHPRRRAEHDYSALIPQKFQRFNKIVKNIRKSIMDCVRTVQFRMRLNLVIEKALPEIRPLMKDGRRPNKHTLEPILQKAVDGEDWDAWGTKKPSISSVLSYASVKLIRRLCSGEEAVGRTRHVKHGVTPETHEAGEERERQKRVLRSPRHTSYRYLYSHLASDLSPQRRSKRRIASPHGVEGFTQLKDVYVETVGGPLTSEYRRAALACLHIGANCPEDLNDFDLTPAIPDFMKNDQTACELLEERLRMTIRDVINSEGSTASTRADSPSDGATSFMAQSGERHLPILRSSQEGTDENSAAVEDDSSASTENLQEDDSRLKGFTSLRQVFRSVELGQLAAKYRNAAVETLNITVDYPETFTNFDFSPAIPAFVKKDSTVFCLLVKRLRAAAKSSQNFKRTMHIAHAAMPEIAAAVDNGERLTSAKLVLIYAKLIEQRGWTENVPLPTYVLATVKKTTLLKDIHIGKCANLGEGFGVGQTDRESSEQPDSLLQEAVEEADAVQMTDASFNFVDPTRFIGENSEISTASRDAGLNAARDLPSTSSRALVDGILAGPPPVKICKRESLFAHFDVKMEGVGNTGNQPRTTSPVKKTPPGRVVQRPQLRVDVTPSSASDSQHNQPGPSGISPASIESVHISSGNSPTSDPSVTQNAPQMSITAEIGAPAVENDDDDVQIIAPVEEGTSSGKCGSWSPTRSRHALSHFLRRQPSTRYSQSSTRSSNGTSLRTTPDRHFTRDDEEIIEMLAAKIKYVPPEKREQMMAALQEKVNRKVAERMLEITQCISAEQRMLLIESVLNEE